MNYGPWITLHALRKGAIFETRDGIRAVKSEYWYSNYSAPQCVLLESGEYAHFPLKLNEVVREIVLFDFEEKPEDETEEERVSKMETVTSQWLTRRVCVDPDKMHGAADGFGGSDYEVPKDHVTDRSSLRRAETYLCEDCGAPAQHVESWNNMLGYLAWCEAHTPWSGHYEWCPKPCVEMLARGNARLNPETC